MVIGRRGRMPGGNASAGPGKPSGDSAGPTRPLVLYALSVGGGTLALCPLPGAGGDYRGDLDLIRDWQPGLVISLATEIEMLAAGGRHLGTDIQSLASRWAHLPVEDYGVPTPEIEARWPAVSRSARQALAGGGRVLVHCRGGCGRSGMVALRLMIECGEPAASALKHLRHVRPCAVETKAQMTWATRRAP